MSNFLAQINIGEDFKLKDGESLSTTFAGGIRSYISQILPNILAVTALILLFFIIGGGISFALTAGNPEAQQKSKGVITNAVLGFFIIFTSFWIIRIIETLTGITILSSN